VCLENTHNRGGGKVYPIEKIEAISAWTRKNNLVLHLDGARIWNAIVATGISGADWAKHFDSVSVCFSKGLGAPVGSALAGTKDFIAKGRRTRKLFGGGMRQAGILAAAALYAMDHHIDRMAEDHSNAQLIAQAVMETPGLRLAPPEVETNLIWIDVDQTLGTAKEVSAKLREHGVWIYALGPQRLRACTHLDVSREQAERTAEVIRTVVGRRVAVPAGR
jgi:threonine aldolase